MAANTKNKKRVKGKTLDLNTFLGSDADAPSGYAVVQPRRIDWADAMDNEDLDDRYTLDYKKEEKLVLPTAPKATRGPDVDLTKVPLNPPFTAFLGNLPYDVSENDIAYFFRQLQVKNVRLPRENGEGRIRGFGYAEFNTRPDLLQALALNNESLKNRAIKVSLAGEHDGDRDRRDAGPDRTLGDWRSEKRETTFSRDEPARNDTYQAPRGGGFSDRDSFRGRSNYDRPFERNERNDRPFERTERNGDRSERSGDYGSRGDRGFGREDDRRGNDRGYGFSSDRGMRSGNSSGGRDDRRDGGRDFGSGSYGRRDDYGRDSRYRESSNREGPPRDSYERKLPEIPSGDSGTSAKERPRLQLAPRTKPIEHAPPPAEAVATSSIFGGAKPVDTAAKEREIEERLAREKDGVKDPKESRDVEVRSRKYSSGSGISNRSRRSSDSGPSGSQKEDEDVIPPYKPPIPRQLERDSQSYSTLPKAQQRCSSTSSNGSSDRDVRAGDNVHSKTDQPPNSRKENYNSIPRNEDVRPNSDDDHSGGFRSARHNHSHRDNSRERALHGTTYEEPKPPVYTSANKFSHLMNDTDDVDREVSE